MKRTQWKDFFREIKKSLNRYLSILFIVALGVAFYAGVRSAEPDMELSVDKYYDDSNVMDIQVLGSLGVTDEDLNAIKEIKGITDAEGAYDQDVLFQGEENEEVISIFSISNKMNHLTVMEGRLPQNSRECFMDITFMEENGHKIGDAIKIKSGTKKDLKDALKEETYTIVGFGISPFYLSLERGTTKIGNGSVNYFMGVLPESFSMDVYTSIYATVDSVDSLQTYSDTYEEKVGEILDEIEEIADVRCEIRYQSVKGEAIEKIEEAEEEIADGKEKLSDGEKKIEDAEKKMASGKKKISKQDKKIEDARVQLEDGEKELEKGKEQLRDGWEKIKTSEIKLNKEETKLLSGETELKVKEKELKSGKQKLEEAKSDKEKLQKGSQGLKTVEGYQYACMRMELLKGKEKEQLTEDELQELAFYQQILPMMQSALKKVGAKQTQNAQILSAVVDGIFKEYDTKLQEQETQLQKGESTLTKAKAKISKGKNKIKEAKGQLKEAKEEISEKEKELKDAEKTLKDKKKEWEEGKEKLNNAKKELAEKDEEFIDAKNEFIKEKQKAEKEIWEGEEEIADAKEEIEKIEEAKWHVLDRNSIQTYVEYGMDSERIGAIGLVFPVIFFLVAALVSLTTMTRMVEDERTQIGTLKALGYSNVSISMKYILYALSASLAGGIIGVLVGSYFLPKVILSAYAILYNHLHVMLTPIHWDLGILSIGIAVFCTVFATLFACYKEFLETPSNLMRPSAPKQGKRVLLERIPFLWKRLKFTSKATVRNLLRYKKRFFMTVFGIGACMALLLVGFGLRDSISEIVNKQYTSVWKYDMITAIKEKESKEQLEETEKVMEEHKDEISQYLLVKQTSLDVENGGKGKNKVQKNGYLFVPEDLNRLGEFVVFEDRVSKEQYMLSDDGVIITEKLAKMLNVKVGGTIYLKDGNTKRYAVKVTAITQNYLYHYIYMTPTLYQNVYGKEPKYDGVFYKIKELSEKQQQELGHQLLKDEKAKSVTYVGEQEKQVGNMMDSLDLVVWVLIGAAALLAFIVLYNLNNINMIERKRELATIKVLGFYDVELAEYVYRENVLLTIVGTGVGILLGLIMHRLVIETCEIEAVMFGREIGFVSYILSILLTIVFAVLVNGWMYFKLKKIDMVESLKSVE